MTSLDLRSWYVQFHGSIHAARLIINQEGPDSDSDDSDSNGSGSIVSGTPTTAEFNLGRFCGRRTQVYHEFTHWEVRCFLFFSMTR